MSDTKQVYQSLEGGVEKRIDDDWKYLYESAKNNDHLTIHGATIQSLIESSRDLQAERDRLQGEFIALEQVHEKEVVELKARVEELERANQINHDEYCQSMEDIGVPKCPIHGSYCAPHVAKWMRETKERAEQAEADLAREKERSARLEQAVVIACRSGKFGNPESAAKKIISSLEETR